MFNVNLKNAKILFLHFWAPYEVHRIKLIKGSKILTAVVI
jgi:hypothetical protein